MKYIRVKWTHAFPDEPVWLYSEIDDERWESRKVDIFPDGHLERADNQREIGSTFLSVEPIPELGEINAQDEFEAVEIDGREFEQVWASAVARTS